MAAISTMLCIANQACRVVRKPSPAATAVRGRIRNAGGY